MFVVQVEARDALLEYLNRNGVGAGIHYPVPIHMLGCYKHVMEAEVGERLLECTRIASQVLSLPLYPEITSMQIERVCGLISSFMIGTGVEEASIQ